MRIRRFLFILLLLFLLPGCGQKAPDAETTALIEASDAVCLAKMQDVRRIPAPEGDGWAYLLTCRVEEDYLGSLTKYEEEAILFWRPEVLLTEEEFRAFGAEYRKRFPADGNTELTLFLKLSADGVTFVPAGENALRWGSPTDAAGIRLREALRVYGNKHPREWLGLG